jgi:hypothetical protein
LTEVFVFGVDLCNKRNMLHNVPAGVSEIAIGRQVQLQGRMYFESASKVKILLYRLFVSNELFEMNFADAMYNCLLRRMELVAFDRADELHRYWNTSSYYGKAMGIGDSIFTYFNRFHQVYLSLRNHALLDCGNYSN